MAQQGQSFTGALIERLPQELVDMIADLVFKNDCSVNQVIEAGYHPPSILQVNQAYRKRLLVDYYRYTTFTTEVQADRPDISDCWIDSIPLEVRDAIYRRGDWWGLRLRSPDPRKPGILPSLLIDLYRWWVIRACDICRKRVKYWKVFAACSACESMIDSDKPGIWPKDLENWRKGELTLKNVSLAAV